MDMVTLFKKGWFKRGAVALALAAVLSCLMPQAARAQCEAASAIGPELTTINQEGVDLLNRLVLQEVGHKETTGPDGTGGFAPNIMRSALRQMIEYILAFGNNIIQTLQSWAREDWLTGFKDMTKELHVAHVDQTWQIGLLTDAKLQVENKLRVEKYLRDGHRRYAPSELACEIDSVGPGLARSYQISRALNHGLALDSIPRRLNARSAPSNEGKGKDLAETWREYSQMYCDATMGDQGCTAAMTLAGRHRDLPGMLWGSRQTIDPSNPDNLRAMKAALRYFIHPVASDPVMTLSVDSAAGFKAILERRAEQAFINTIYNVLGGMLSERIGGSGVNAQLMRVASGVPIENASTDASYREIQDAFTRDRFHNPTYLVRLIGDPTQIAREQGTLNALKLQTMNDTFRRLEERLFMEASAYSRDLEIKTTGPAAKPIPFFGGTAPSTPPPSTPAPPPEAETAPEVLPPATPVPPATP